MTRIVKATDTERAAYKATGAVYPLYGWVQFDGRKLAVEDLRGCWRAPDPVYEVIAPTGFHFRYDDTHSLLCHSLRDVQDRLKGGSLEACGEACGSM